MPPHADEEEDAMITAIVLIDTEANQIPEVAAAVADIEGVSEVYSVTGEVDLIALVLSLIHI